MISRKENSAKTREGRFKTALNTTATFDIRNAHRKQGKAFLLYFFSAFQATVYVRYIPILKGMWQHKTSTYQGPRWGDGEGGALAQSSPPFESIDSMANAFKATKGLLQLLDT